MVDRALPLLRKIARKHLLVMVLFKDRELEESAEKSKQSIEDVYRVTLSRQHLAEREEISLKLRKQGIHTVVSTPKKLSIDVINKYLELKSRGII
jgi:uncharacterized protein (DUF58 family)